MRISGLASGMDIDAMVKEMMKSRRASYDKVVKQRMQIEWQREDYRTISTRIVDFRNNKLASFNLSAAINAKTAEITGDKNAIQLNSTLSTAAGSLNVQVEKLATAETRVYNFGAENASETLASLGFESDSSVPGNVQLTINGEKISLSGDATLKELANAINARTSKTKATALYNANTGQLSISATVTGENKLVMNFPEEHDDIMDIVTPGAKGEVYVNGILYEQDSNRFNLNGVDFTVRSKTDAPATISVVQDTSKIVDTIKSFVEEYNSLIALINGELSEEKFRTFLPLTSEEKAALSEKEVELWESKARSGMLRNDSILSKYVSDLRIITTSLVAGVKLGENSSLSIGITTGSYSEKGKLVLDEAKLRNALESNPNEVVALFSGSSGVFTRMRETSMTALTDLNKLAGTSLTSTDANAAFMASSLIGERIKNMESRESLMLMRLNNLEIQYYKQFTAMETAISRFNSQSASIASFF